MTALAMHTHDLSLVGLAYWSNQWHAFPGQEHLIPTSTVLPFGNSYRDLIGGLKNLPSMSLGQAPAPQAVGTLSANDPATADDNDVEAVKRALATLAVTACEAQRLRTIKKTVQTGWGSGDARIAVEHLPCIEYWDTICFEVIRSNRTGEWSGPLTELLRKSANVHSREEPRAVIDLRVDRIFEELLLAHARSA